MTGPLLPALLLVAGLARAVHDALTHTPGCLARWGAWWDARASWRLKYRGGEPTLGARFPGSTTVLVGFTDAWHCSNLVAWGCADAALLLVSWTGPWRWWAVVAITGRRVVFEPLYRYLRWPR
jgi:hypothetical protein